MKKEITNSNIKSFIEYYHYFHDSSIIDINYDTKKSIIELTMDVWWSGNPILKEDNTYEKNNTKIKMFFSDIKDYCENNPYDSNYIDSITLKFFKMHNTDLIWLSVTSENPDEDPLLYIVARKLEYSEIKDVE